MDPVPSQELELQINELRKRIYWLEQALLRHGIALQQEPPRQAVAPAAPSPIPAAPELPTLVPPRAPQPVTTVTAPARPLIAQAITPPADTRSLENRIGSQWFNRIGILAVLISMAWFLKLAIDNHWIGPAGRVLIGLIAGAALIAWSERFRSKGYPAFSYSLKALGSGILYLSLWAAFSLFHLIPSSVAFVAMIAVTAFNGFMAWVQDAELLGLYAIAGALSTPLLISEGGNHEITLFSYLFMLDLAVLVLVILKPWSRLLFASFLGTIFFFTGWWMSFYSDAQAGRSAAFVTLFFLLFAFAPRLIKLRSRAAIGSDAQLASAWDNLVGMVVPLVNAALAFLAFYAIVDESTACWIAVAFAAFYLAINSLPERGILRRNPPALFSLHLASAVVFLTLALPLKAHGRWLTTGWLVEGAALLWVASRVQLLLLRVLAVLCLLLGLVALLAVNSPASLTPILNQRFGVYCVAIAAFAFAAWLAAREGSKDHTGDPLPWLVIAPSAILLVNILILVALGWEIHNYWWYLRWHGNSSLYHDSEMYAHFSYSGLFMLFGAILLSVGFWKRSAFVRWQALVLLAATIGKVFLVDMSELSQGYRILSFLGLGVLLLGVSYAYQRDWLNLRKPSHDGPPNPSPNPDAS